MRKTWEQKYATGRPPKRVVLTAPYAGAPAGATMLVANPEMVEAGIRRIPRGHSTTIPAFREALAKDAGADTTCPTSTAIFLRIVAERALEHLAAGKRPTPFWRVIGPDTPLASRLSCGPAFIAARLAEEAQ
jgi:hypothetical protein